MATITGDAIITNYGEQQLLAGTFNVTKVKLGSGVWSPTVLSTALNTLEADLVASGTVEDDGASGSRLHVTATDGSGNAYDWHEFALTDNTDQALAIYSQAAVIAAKGSGTSLGVAFDWIIESAAPGTIQITGPTTYDLPQASPTIPGIIEIATDAEVLAATDGARAIVPSSMDQVKEYIRRDVVHPRTWLRVLTGQSPAGPDIQAIAGKLVNVSFFGSQLWVDAVSGAFGTAADTWFGHVQVVDSGIFSNISQIEASTPTTSRLVIDIKNNSNQDIPLDDSALVLGITIYGDVP